MKVFLPQRELAEFCRRWKIQRLEVFGSALRDDFRPDSDIDFLYSLSADAGWGWTFFNAAEELAQLVGRPVDLISRFGIEHSRNVKRRSEILAAARVVYAA